MNTTIMHCTKCIMPDSFPGISFNDEGICNFCQGYEPYHKLLGKDKLLEILTSRPPSGKYNCVVPISGGKDSIYILYYVVRMLKLRPIAVTYNSGFQHAAAIGNARTACDILEAPLVEVKSPSSVRIKMLKESFMMHKKLGYPWHECGNCEAILRKMAISTANTYGAHFVVWGSSALESGDGKTYVSYKDLGSPRADHLKKAISKFRVLLRSPEKIYELPRRVYSYVGFHAFKYYFFSISERLALGFPYRFAFRPNAIPPFWNKNCEFVHFFDYIEWDSINNLQLLKKELNWKHPVGKDARWDCALHCIGNHESLKKFGISNDGINSCNFIRENKIERDEAMKKETDLRNSIDQECAELTRGIGLENFRVP